jgi:hypothetical protein
MNLILKELSWQSFYSFFVKKSIKVNFNVIVKTLESRHRFPIQGLFVTNSWPILISITITKNMGQIEDCFNFQENFQKKWSWKEWRSTRSPLRPWPRGRKTIVSSHHAKQRTVIGNIFSLNILLTFTYTRNGLRLLYSQLRYEADQKSCGTGLRKIFGIGKSQKNLKTYQIWENLKSPKLVLKNG